VHTVSAEVTTLWRFTNMLIIIIIVVVVVVNINIIINIIMLAVMWWRSAV